MKVATFPHLPSLLLSSHPEGKRERAYGMLKSDTDAETRAVERLIAQIDALDQWRDRTGRRVIWLFGGTFLAAVSLLVWVAVFDGAPGDLMPAAGPRAPAVLNDFHPR